MEHNVISIVINSANGRAGVQVQRASGILKPKSEHNRVRDTWCNKRAAEHCGSSSNRSKQCIRTAQASKIQSKRWITATEKRKSEVTSREIQSES